MVANRDIEVGEVLFVEEPIVTYYSGNDQEIVASPACHHCFITVQSGLVPCPTCSCAIFCRLEIKFLFIFALQSGLVPCPTCSCAIFCR